MSTRVKEKKAAARLIREQLAREKRRRQRLLTGSIALAVLVIAGLIGWGVVANQKPASGATPPSAVSAGTGFAEGKGPVTVDVYADFMCPICKNFETQSGRTLEQLADSGKATVVYHPIAILDGKSTTGYSTRAAAASAAAADGGKFYEYFQALYAQQPQEGGPGLDDGRLIEIGRSVGLTGDDFADKVTKGTYKPWVTRSTEAAARRGVNGTPTVYVADKQLQQPTPATITTAVDAAAR